MNTLKFRLLSTEPCGMTQERAMEIVRSIHSDRWGWQGNTDKFFREGELDQVRKKWLTMPGYTCFADALYAIARGD